MNRNWNRREFLQKTSTATLAALAVGMPASLVSSCAKPKIKSKADTVILLWMAGGMAHTDTFDPKKIYTLRKGDAG